MRTIHYFHVYADGKTLKELSEQEYQAAWKRLWNLGWIDESSLWIRKNYISKSMLFKIMRLAGWIVP